MTAVPLYTARQAALAIVTAARRFGVDPDIIALGRAGYRRQSPAVTSARKAVVLALAAETGGAMMAIGFALGWHGTRNAASAAHAPVNLPGGTFQADVATIRAALRGEAVTATAPEPIAGPEAEAVPAPSAVPVTSAAPVTGPKPVCAVPAAKPARSAASARIDYTGLTEAQIAEHEMCEALLARAERSEGQLATAARLARTIQRGAS